MYTHLPKSLVREDYEKMAARAAQVLGVAEGVKAVYLLGDIWQPGISDMDLLVVFKDGSQPGLVSPWSMGELAEYIFTHRFLSMNEMTARKFFYLFPFETTDVRLISGRKIDFENPHEVMNVEEYRDLIACVFFDILITKLLPLAGIMMTEKNINIRSRIGAVYSLRYSEILLKILCQYEMSDHLRRRIVSLRNKWFDRTQKENLSLLEEVSQESILLIADMTQEFAKYTRARYPITSSHIFNNQRYTLTFSDNWTLEEFERKYYRGHIHLSLLGRKFEHDVLLLPRELSVYLAWYASGEGVLSRRMRKIYKESARQQSMPVGVRMHIEALNTAFKGYSTSMGVHKIPYTLGFRAIQSYWRDMVGWGILHLLR